jgi:uncharacterized protein (TIGR02145 family)
MKSIYTFLFSIVSLVVSAQTQQNVNKSFGTFSNPITDIDSIRFDVNTNQMVVVTNSGDLIHNLTEITDVTFGSVSNLTSCTGGLTAVSDIDGNTYPVVQIGSQCWMAENLRTTKFNNGTVIPNVMGNLDWVNVNAPAWCNINNNPLNDTIYGKLYNWFTVSAANVCPTGWHVPTDDEWTVLTDYLGGELIAGGKMKSVSGWNSPNVGATNESGFSALPGSLRLDLGGDFIIVGSDGFWWSAFEVSSINAWYRYLSTNNSEAYRDFTSKKNGKSVRCIRD